MGTPLKKLIADIPAETDLHITIIFIKMQSQPPVIHSER